MAAWWGAGEEILTTGSMELFNAFALDEVTMSDSRGRRSAVPSALHACVDVGAPRLTGLKESSPASSASFLPPSSYLLCPGDADRSSTLTPDLSHSSRLLHRLDSGEGQGSDDDLSTFIVKLKIPKLSPLRRFLSLARSPPEREPFSLRGHRTLSSSSSSSSKPRMIRFGGEARSDGEEEEEEGEAGGSAQGSESETDPASPEMVELAVSLPLEPGTDSMALCELVKHMHPYCLTVCLEGSEPELPEGGLVLEILGPGEQEQTPVASPEPSPPAVVPADGTAESPQRRTPPGGGSTQGEALPAAPSSPAEAGLPAEEDEGNASEDRPRQEASEKRPSRRRKKRKDKEVQPPQKVPEGSPEANVSSPPETPKNAERNPTDLLERSPAEKPGLREPSPAAAPEVKPGVPALGSDSHSPAPPVSHGPVVQGGGKTAAGGEGPSVPQPKEPKPRLLSLEEYRLLRQKKKPQPAVRAAVACSRELSCWNSALTFHPKESPRASPCLPEPTPPGLRRASVDPAPSAMPAWQPIGPGAPPTPEALLVPPGMASAPSKPAPTSKPTARPAPEETLKPQPNSVSPKSNSGAADPVARVGGPSPAPAFSLTSAAQGVPPSRPVPPAAAAAAAAPCLPARDKLPRAETCAPPVPAAARPATSRKPSPAEALIQAFTSEIGIEASDLTSLLEQFEETQAKEEQSVPEVCGKAAAVGNSSSEPQPDGKSLERGLFLGLASSAGLTPPATPPHHPWKPVTPAAVVQGKPKPAEVPRPCSSKAIQIIDPRPLPRAKTRPPAAPAPAPAPAPTSQIPAFTDHDYCLPQTEPAGSDLGTRWNVKQLPVITIKPIERPSPPAPVSTKPPGVPVTPSPKKFISQPLDHRTQPAMGILSGSVMLSPESSPCRLEADGAPAEKPPSSRTFRYDESPASPPAEERGRARRRYRVRSPSSSSSSSDSDSQSSSESGSRSPPRKRSEALCIYDHEARRNKRFSIMYVLFSEQLRVLVLYSSSRSGSWSRSRSRSPGSPPRHWRSRRRSRRSVPGVRGSGEPRRSEEQRRSDPFLPLSQEERRVVYIGKIRGGMTRKELKERFSLFGEIEECTLHFREHGDNYGFVTYTHTHDAFTAIEKGNKLRNPDELPFDLCFGGRRQFCKTSYADLDSNREFDPGPAKSKFDALDFDTLLKQAQKGLRR
ncbi:PPRC1 protein, partial [Atractosteus spatula]|nr:PPRC1 protein [Atractosteus spatula]